MPNWPKRLRPLNLRRWVTVQTLSLIRRPSQLCTPWERIEIERDIHANAKLTPAFFLLLICACGIATIGLMQSSVAVLIGAMLISPLMAPIMSMGMALARLEFREFRDATSSLIIGALISILAGMVVAWISPLKEFTPEILARTRPTLLDLGVAALSGLIGAYVTISRKGGVIAGVAIATALLPPLNVVGFSLAMGALSMAGGAFLLFITNVVAILGVVFAVSRRYGFKPSHAPGTRWEGVAILTALAIICAPLALSLSDIVAEARLTNQVRADLDAAFRHQLSRVSDLSVNVRHGEVRSVQAIVITQAYVADVETRLRKAYPDASAVNVEQVLVANDTLAAGLRPQTPANPATTTTEAFLTQAVGRVATIKQLQNEGRSYRLSVELKTGSTLSDYRSLEDALRRLTPDAEVTILPPPLPLPLIRFEANSARMANSADLDTLIWAAQRRGIKRLQLVIHAGTRQQTLARQRAAILSEQLQNTGLSVSSALSLDAEGDTDKAEAFAAAD